MVGKPEDHPEETEPRVYALDRVKELGLTDKKWHFPKDFDANAFFSGHFGVDHQGKPEHVRIRVDARTAQYMNTLPLHHSQKEELRTPEYSEFSFFIALTYDFKQELRKQGSNLQVLAPDHLRDEFVQEYQNALDKYRTL